VCKILYVRAANLYCTRLGTLSQRSSLIDELTEVNRDNLSTVLARLVCMRCNFAIFWALVPSVALGAGTIGRCSNHLGICTV